MLTNESSSRLYCRRYLKGFHPLVLERTDSKLCTGCSSTWHGCNFSVRRYHLNISLLGFFTSHCWLAPLPLRCGEARQGLWYTIKARLSRGCTTPKRGTYHQLLGSLGSRRNSLRALGPGKTFAPVSNRMEKPNGAVALGMWQSWLESHSDAMSKLSRRARKFLFCSRVENDSPDLMSPLQ